MSRTLRRRSFPIALLCGALAACRSAPPALTGITISAAAADGSPDSVSLERTRLEPPVPLIGLRPGSDPQRGALFLNHPTSGEIAVTLGRGRQSFLLFTLAKEPQPYYVIGLFLEGESTPALSALIASAADAPLHASSAPTIMGLGGDAVANASALSVARRGYRVTLRSARFPLSGLRLDTVGPWNLRPDNTADAIGIVSLDVEMVGAGD